MLVQYAGASLLADIAELQDHSLRYRTALGHDASMSLFAAGADEHRRMVVACQERNSDEAGRVLARHLARSATDLISRTDPAYDAMALREALRVVLGDAPPL
jgi:DNA-binding GntR family transcriptional regulator